MSMLPGSQERRPENQGEGKERPGRSCVHSLGGSFNGPWEWS